jgi:hypothetical protein
MKDKSAKSRKSASPELPLLSPADAQLLEQLVAAVAQALADGREPGEVLQTVALRPQDPAWDLHLVARLSRLTHPALPALLAGLFGEAADKARRKALKKALHVFKSRGLSVAPDLIPREEAVVLKTPAPELTAYLSPYFGKDERYIVLEGPVEVLGGTHLVSRFSDEAGFRECFLLNLRRKQRAEFWEHFKNHGLDDWVQAPPGYALKVLEEAWTLNPDSEGGAARFAGVKDRLRRHLSSSAQTPDLDRLLPAMSEAERRQALERSAELARGSVFYAWLPAPEEIMPWLNKLREAETSVLILSELQQQERRQGVVDEAVQAFFPPQSRPQWGRRLLEMAYFLNLKGRPQEARVAQAAGEDLLAGAASPLMGENPFFRALVAFALTLAEQLVEPPPEAVRDTGLITPGQFPPLVKR